MRSLKLLLILPALLMIQNTVAVQILWTGAASNNWHDQLNWSPLQVPGPADNVVIPSGTVFVNNPATVDTVTLATQGPAVLTISNTFNAGGGGISALKLGTVVVNTPLDAIVSAVDTAIIGGLNFTSGTLSGMWSVFGSANLNSPNTKRLLKCNFTAGSGNTNLGGTIQLNQSSTFLVTGAAALTAANTNLTIQSDGSESVFDAASASSVVFSGATSTFTIQAPILFGTLTLLSGNLNVLADLTFAQAFNIPAGSTLTASGDITFNASMGFTGNGSAILSCAKANLGPFSFAGSLTLLSGLTRFVGASAVTTLTLSGATVAVVSTLTVSTVSIVAGSFAGTGSVTATNAVFSASSFVVGAPVLVTASATFNAGVLAFASTGSLTLSASTAASIVGATTLTAASAGITGLTNNGMLRVMSTFTSQNVNVAGTGTTNVTASAAFNAASLVQTTVALGTGATLTGNNAALSLGSVSTVPTGTVKAIIGIDVMSCPGMCVGISIPPNNFTFTASA